VTFENEIERHKHEINQLKSSIKDL